MRRTLCRLEVGDTADWKPALESEACSRDFAALEETSSRKFGFHRWQRNSQSRMRKKSKKALQNKGFLHMIRLTPPRETKGKSRMKNLIIILTTLGFIVPSVFAQNTPPTLTCPESTTVDCAGTNGAPVNLTATVSDAETNAVTVVWFVDGTAYQTNDLAAGTTATSVAVTFSGMFGLGEHEVVVSASDGGPAVSCTNTLEIVADAPPVITNIMVSPRVLWPPNHKMRRIQLNVQASDDCGSVTSRVVSVTSNEPELGRGSGNHAPDWIIGQDGSLALRAERSGKNKGGRIYTITIATSDEAGNSTNGTVTVIVPHDRRKGSPPAPKPEKPTPPGKAKEKNKGKKK